MTITLATEIKSQINEEELIFQEALSIEEVSQLMSIDKDLVLNYTKKRILCALNKNNTLKFPKFQFFNDHFIRGFDKVYKNINHNVRLVDLKKWFETSHDDLYLDETEDISVSPLKWLIMGFSIEVIINLAEEDLNN